MASVENSEQGEASLEPQRTTHQCSTLLTKAVRCYKNEEFETQSGSTRYSDALGVPCIRRQRRIWSIAQPLKTSCNLTASNTAKSTDSKRPNAIPSRALIVSAETAAVVGDQAQPQQQQQHIGVRFSAKRPEVLPDVAYYLEPPGSFSLELLIAPETVWREERGIPHGNKPGHLVRMRNKPPIVITTTQFTRGRPERKLPPVYVLGRNSQEVDDIPTEARKWFSRKHCSLEITTLNTGEVRFHLHDLTSMNGTFLNGLQLPEGGVFPLKDGDIIGVSMTAEGLPLLAFRFTVPALAARSLLLQDTYPRRSNAGSAAIGRSSAPSDPHQSSVRRSSVGAECECLDCLLLRKPQLLADAPIPGKHFTSDNETSETAVAIAVSDCRGSGRCPEAKTIGGTEQAASEEIQSHIVRHQPLQSNDEAMLTNFPGTSIPEIAARIYDAYNRNAAIDFENLELRADSNFDSVVTENVPPSSNMHVPQETTVPNGDSNYLAVVPLQSNKRPRCSVYFG